MLLGGNIKSKWPQFVAVMSATLGTITDGMQYGWTAPVNPKLLQNDSPIKVTPPDEIWIENIYMIGALSALPLTMLYTKKLGRKLTVLLGAGQHVVAWILIATTSSIGVLYFARFLAGAAGNIAFVSIPMYIGEIADKNIRGFLGTFIYSNMMLGVVIIYSIAPFTTITISSSVGIAISVLQILTFSFMPESPYYLVIKGRQKKALKSLKWLRNTEDVCEEMDEITKAVQRQESERGRFIDLFIVKSNLKPFIIACAIGLGQQFGGISVLMMNLHSILGEAETVMPAATASIVVVVLMLVACVTSSVFIDRFGRKMLLISSSIFTGISLTILAIYFAFKNSGYDVTNVSWIPLFSVLMYSLSFKYGLGMVPIVLLGEIFPTKMKSIGLPLADISYALFAVISVYLFMYLSDTFGMHVPFFLFVACCALMALFSYMYVPETKGKTLEQIQMIFRGETI